MSVLLCAIFFLSGFSALVFDVNIQLIVRDLAINNKIDLFLSRQLRYGVHPCCNGTY